MPGLGLRHCHWSPRRSLSSASASRCGACTSIADLFQQPRNRQPTGKANMQYRNLGASGLKVPALSFGAGTFGGEGPLFSAWGNSSVEEARRLIDICLEAGVNLFDSADVYSHGAAETVLGAAIKNRRDKVLISTKTSLPMG